jgi:hypothetical protein
LNVIVGIVGEEEGGGSTNWQLIEAIFLSLCGEVGSRCMPRRLLSAAVQMKSVKDVIGSGCRLSRRPAPNPTMKSFFLVHL